MDIGPKKTLHMQQSLSPTMHPYQCGVCISTLDLTSPIYLVIFYTVLKRHTSFDSENMYRSAGCRLVGSPQSTTRTEIISRTLTGSIPINISLSSNNLTSCISFKMEKGKKKIGKNESQPSITPRSEDAIVKLGDLLLRRTVFLGSCRLSQALHTMRS